MSTQETAQRIAKRIRAVIYEHAIGEGPEVTEAFMEQIIMSELCKHPSPSISQQVVDAMHHASRKALSDALDKERATREQPVEALRKIKGLLDLMKLDAKERNSAISTADATIFNIVLAGLGEKAW